MKIGIRDWGLGIGKWIVAIIIFSLFPIPYSLFPRESDETSEFYKSGLFYIFSDQIKDEKGEDAIFLKSESLFFLSDYKRAYQNYSRVKECSLDETNEKLPIIYYRIGDCLWFMDKKGEAISAYQDALSKYPNNPSSSDAIFRQIQYYLGIQDYDRAVELFSCFLKDYPDIPWKDSVFYLLADTFEQTKDYNRAILYYKKVFELSKDDKLRMNSLFSLSKYYFDMNDFEKSFVYAKELTELYPSDRAFILLFSCFFNMKKFEEAVSIFPKILKPSQELYLAYAESLYNLGRFDEASYSYIKAGGTSTGLPHSYIKLGKLDLALDSLKNIVDDKSLYLIAQKGYNNEKIVSYSKIINEYPESGFREEAFLRLSLLYLKMGSITESLSMCDRMVKEYPKSNLSLILLYNIGISLENEEYLLKIVNLYPNFSKNPEILYKIGENRIKKTRYKEAMEVFKSLIDKYPKSELFAPTLYNIAFLDNRFGNPKKAAIAYRSIAAIDRNLGEKALFYAANISFNLKEYNLAINDYQAFIRQYPKSTFVPAAIYQMGWCYYKKEQFDNAEKWFTKVILNYKESQYYPPSLYWLGWSYFMQERYEEAQVAYLRLQKEFPEDALSKDAYLRIGLCFYNQGRYKDANEQYQKLIEKGADKALMEEALYQIGEGWIKQNKASAAINYYKLFLEKSLDKELNKKIRKRIAQIYYSDGKKKESREEYKKLLLEELSDNEREDIYYWIGKSYLPDAKEEAIVYFRKVYELYPKSEWAPDALFRIAVILYESGDYKNAILEFKNLIKNYSRRDDLIKEAKGWIIKIEKK